VVVRRFAFDLEEGIPRRKLPRPLVGENFGATKQRSLACLFLPSNHLGRSRIVLHASQSKLWTRWGAWERV